MEKQHGIEMLGHLSNMEYHLVSMADIPDSLFYPMREAYDDHPSDVSPENYSKYREGMRLIIDLYENHINKAREYMEKVNATYQEIMKSTINTKLQTSDSDVICNKSNDEIHQAILDSGSINIYEAYRSGFKHGVARMRLKQQLGKG